jgi:hypothetical protein
MVCLAEKRVGEGDGKEENAVDHRAQDRATASFVNTEAAWCSGGWV